MAKTKVVRCKKRKSNLCVDSKDVIQIKQQAIDVNLALEEAERNQNECLLFSIFPYEMLNEIVIKMYDVSDNYDPIRTVNAFSMTCKLAKILCSDDNLWKRIYEDNREHCERSTVTGLFKKDVTELNEINFLEPWKHPIDVNHRFKNVVLESTIAHAHRRINLHFPMEVNPYWLDHRTKVAINKFEIVRLSENDITCSYVCNENECHGHEVSVFQMIGRFADPLSIRYAYYNSDDSLTITLLKYNNDRKMCLDHPHFADVTCGKCMWIFIQQMWLTFIGCSIRLSDIIDHPCDVARMMQLYKLPNTKYERSNTPCGTMNCGTMEWYKEVVRLADCNRLSIDIERGLLDRYYTCNDWERRFVQSVVDRGRTPTEKQMKIVKRILSRSIT